MITNADITIYNHRLNNQTRLDEWRRTVIHGVHFHVANKSSVGDKGLHSADVYKIRIPTDADYDGQYVSPEEYQALESTAGYWTIQSGDYVVRGECEMQIEKPSDLMDRYFQMCKVTSWSDNRFGGLPHWRIGGE